MITKFYFFMAVIVALSACKKNDNTSEKQKEQNIVKDFISKQDKSSIIKETITLNQYNPLNITLDWNSQKTFQKNNRTFIEIPYIYNNDKSGSNKLLVAEIKNNIVLGAKIKDISLISYLNNSYFAEYWYNTDGKLSELWQWNNYKFSKLDISPFTTAQLTNSRTSNCYQMSGTYWTYSSGGGDLPTVTATPHTYYYTLCFVDGGSSEDQDAGGGDYGGGGGGGGGVSQITCSVISDALNSSQFNVSPVTTVETEPAQAEYKTFSNVWNVATFSNIFASADVSSNWSFKYKLVSSSSSQVTAYIDETSISSNTITNGTASLGSLSFPIEKNEVIILSNNTIFPEARNNVKGKIIHDFGNAWCNLGGERVFDTGKYAYVKH